jgi:hypothetical protein
MPKVRFEEQFRFSPNGYDLVVYEPGEEPVDVSERCAEVALETGAAVEPATEPDQEPNQPQARKSARGKR